jgi:hypothetical protein
MCQRATGGLFAALAGGSAANFAWTRGTPSFFASSNPAKRAYCEKCGTPLTFKYDREDARLYVTIGSLDDPEAAAPIIQYGIESRISWVKFCESVPAEITGQARGEQEFFAGMESHQRTT